MNQKKTIVLDCDGVILDYNTQFAVVYEHAFSKKLEIIEPRAYHAVDCWGVQFTPDEKSQFYKSFDTLGWGGMPAFPGVKESIDILKNLGYKIIIVTSMNDKARDLRIKNLQALGIYFDELYATGRVLRHENPKKEILNQIKPDYFVDDLITNFEGLDSSIQRVLIHDNLVGNPNDKHLYTIDVHKTYANLCDFVDYEILQKPKKGLTI